MSPLAHGCALSKISVIRYLFVSLARGGASAAMSCRYVCELEDGIEESVWDYLRVRLDLIQQHTSNKV